MPRAAEPTILQALDTFVGEVGGVVFRFQKGDLIEARHPAAKAWPKLFRDPVIRYASPEPKVESATAAPGEKRGA